MFPEGESVRRIDVFFYGLFMDAALLKAKGVDPQNSRHARVDNFKLSIGERATLSPSDGDAVFGLLFALTHDEIDRLYSEASVRSYRPEAVLAVLENGDTTPALCFNLTASDSASNRNTEYAAKLRELATRLKLPKSYVESI